MSTPYQGLGSLMPPRVWNALLSAGTSHGYRIGEPLLRQGDAGTHVLILTAGHVKVTRVEADGGELLLAVRGPGEVLGEMGVLDVAPRSATVTAVTPCLTYLLAAPRFARIVEEMGLRDLLFRHLLSRYREGEQIRAELSELPASQRVVRMLLRLAPASPGAGGLVLALSQDELARSVGLSRSATAAELAELRRRNLVTTSRRKIVVTDLAGLRALADTRGAH